MLKDKNGNIAIVFALLLPVLLGFVGAGLDYARYRSVLGQLQDIADTAAIAGAREYAIKTDSSEIPKAVAKSIADSGLAAAALDSIASATTDSDDEETTVSVSITAALKPSFLVAMYKNPVYVDVDATAQAVGGANICVIGLNDGAQGTVKLEHDATLTGNDCAVFSNSVRNHGLSSIQNALLDTAFNCSAGGYGGAAGTNFKPAPLTDCPPKEDPLAARPEPSSGMCSLLPNLIKDISTTLTPGVYCGGLTIDGTADVTLLPGIYVIRDGNLEITANARVVGEDVGFFFDGGSSTMTIGADTTVSFSAPTSGEMAGLLIFQSRDSIPNGVFTISSNNAENLVGTIYLPQGQLFVNATSPVAGESAYTAIIAQRLVLQSSVNLILNSDYQATDVPAPAGLANAGGSVRLRE